MDYDWFVNYIWKARLCNLNLEIYVICKDHCFVWSDQRVIDQNTNHWKIAIICWKIDEKEGKSWISNHCPFHFWRKEFSFALLSSIYCYFLESTSRVQRCPRLECVQTHLVAKKKRRKVYFVKRVLSVVLIHVKAWNWSTLDCIGEFKTCSRCKKAIYCSKECQVAHWKNGHKQVCKPAVCLDLRDSRVMMNWLWSCCYSYMNDFILIFIEHYFCWSEDWNYC